MNNFKSNYIDSVIWKWFFTFLLTMNALNSYSLEQDPTRPLDFQIINKETCSKEYQDQIDKVLSGSKSANEITALYVEGTYQKLAYAHNLVSQGSKSENKKLQDNLRDYINAEMNDYEAASKEAKAVLDRLKVFDGNLKTNKSSEAKDIQYLNTLAVFSRSLEAKFQVSELEEKVIKHVGMGKSANENSTWSSLVTDLAKNFHDRRFQVSGKQVHLDRSVLKRNLSKGSKKQNDLQEKGDKIKRDLLNAIKDKNIKVKKACLKFADINENSGMCNVLNPFELGDLGLISSTDKIMERLTNTRNPITLKSPLYVSYVGSKMKFKSCKMTKKEDGTYDVEYEAEYQNIQSGSDIWTTQLHGQKKGLEENKKDNNGLISKNIDRTIIFNISEEDAYKPVEMKFQNSNGNVMYFDGKAEELTNLSNKGERDRTFAITCANQPKRSKAVAAALPGSVAKPILKITKTAGISNSFEVNLSASIKGTEEENKELMLSWSKLLDGETEWSQPKLQKIDEPYVASAMEKATYEARVTVGSDEILSNRLSVDVTFELKLSKTDSEDKSSVVVTATFTPTINDLDLSNIKWESSTGSKLTGSEPDKKAIVKTNAIQKIEATLNINGKDFSSEIEIAALTTPKASLSIDREDKGDNVILKSKLSGLPKEATDKSYAWSCKPESCSGTSESITVDKQKKTNTATLKFTYKIGATLFELSATKPIPSKKKDGDDKEECKDDDAFDNKDSCKEEEETEEKKALKKKYMPPMQKPMVLPPGPTYMTPGFN